MEGDEAALEQRPLPARARVRLPLAEHLARPASRRRRRRRRRAPPRPPRRACRGSGRRSAAAWRSARAGGRRRSAWRSGARAPGRGRGRTRAARRRPARVSKSPEPPTRAALPELLEVARVGGGDRRRVDASRRRSPGASTSRASSSSSRSRPPSPSRTTYLWCIRSRQPGIGLTGTPSVSSTCGSVRGGAGKNGPLAVVRRPLVLVEGDPHAHAARRRVADRVRDAVADRARQAHVVECEVERPRAPRRARPRRARRRPRRSARRRCGCGRRAWPRTVPRPLDFKSDLRGRRYGRD